MSHAYLDAIDALSLFPEQGVVTKVAPGRIEATGPSMPLGALCEIASDDGVRLAEVAAIDTDRVVVVPIEPVGALRPGARVRKRNQHDHVGVGDRFAGRAVDALGRPFDGLGLLIPNSVAPRIGAMAAPLDRIEPDRVSETGVRAIDALLTLGIGQRIGIFAASGVGKTSLIEQLARQMQSDRVILCLVGERGREVEALWRQLSSRHDADRFTVVAATSDESASLRARATDQALGLAEYWRDAGEHVLLIIDSVTRLAMALREIGLAAGEPPTVRAYTPNVFAALPRLVERCGATRKGSITAVMTVLSETDDVDDPIVEVMKALLDGHIVLSRTLAERGHFPAIDLSRSISRLASKLVSPDHARAAQRASELLSVYEQSRLLIESGLYRAGADAQIDRAVAARPGLMALLRQPMDERASLDDAVRALAAALPNRGSGA